MLAPPQTPVTTCHGDWYHSPTADTDPLALIVNHLHIHIHVHVNTWRSMEVALIIAHLCLPGHNSHPVSSPHPPDSPPKLQVWQHDSPSGLSTPWSSHWYTPPWWVSTPLDPPRYGLYPCEVFSIYSSVSPPVLKHSPIHLAAPYLHSSCCLTAYSLPFKVMTPCGVWVCGCRGSGAGG